MNQRRFLKVDLRQYEAEIRRENRYSFRLLSVSGLALGVLNFAVQLIVNGMDMPVFRAALLPVWFALLVFADRVLIPEELSLPTWSLHLAQAPVFILSILLGTVWDPGHQAITILLFLLLSPVFVLDHPGRSLSILVFWSALFSALCWLTKAPDIRKTDLVHIIEFWAAAVVASYALLHLRLISMEKTKTLQHHLSHDRITGSLNRYALEERLSDYTGRPLTVLLADIDQMLRYSDFYGSAAMDVILRHFADTLTRHFGEERTFIYGQDVMLCLIPDLSTEECSRRIAACREEMHAISLEGNRISVTFGGGLVSGTPKTAEDLQGMIQLAMIYTHKAKAIGRNQICAGEFSREALEEEIRETLHSNRHVPSHEINQLTGLPAMTWFTNRADELLQNISDPALRPVIGFFKLTTLKEYNSRYGYEQGDLLIAETGRLLQRAFPSRMVGHITAGQFCFLCYMEEADAGIETLLRLLSEAHPGTDVLGKAGFAEYTGAEGSAELIDQARTAQRSIVARKDLNCCFYNTDLDEELRFGRYIISHLDEAIEQGWIRVYYQPIVRAENGRVCFEEALSRWDDPTHGFLMPFRFIPTLEDRGLMYKLNLHVVDQVLKDCRRRKELGVPVVPVSINLSRRDFSQCDMLSEIAERVDRSGLGREILRIEITESALAGNPELLRREVSRFRKNGFRVWMDDFGSEYSTLNLLQGLDFDMIKIDMQFTRNLMENEKNRIIISHVIRMVRELGITALMEGVETAEQAQLLREMGCDLIQGYYFSRPISLDDIIRCVQSGAGLPFEKNAASGEGSR